MIRTAIPVFAAVTVSLDKGSSEYCQQRGVTRYEMGPEALLFLRKLADHPAAWGEFTPQVIERSNESREKE